MFIFTAVVERYIRTAQCGRNCFPTRDGDRALLHIIYVFIWLQLWSNYKVKRGGFVEDSLILDLLVTKRHLVLSKCTDVLPLNLGLLPLSVTVFLKKKKCFVDYIRREIKTKGSERTKMKRKLHRNDLLQSLFKRAMLYKIKGYKVSLSYWVVIVGWDRIK